MLHRCARYTLSTWKAPLLLSVVKRLILHQRKTGVIFKISGGFKMKKFFNYLCLAAIAGLTLASCSKNETVENLPEKSAKKITFSAKASNPSTKTAFGDKTDAGYPTVWTSAQQVSISLNYASPKQADVTPSADGKTATFDATIADDESGNYVFYALSPAASVISWNATYESVQVDFPASQVPTMKSVDEVAHIMAAKSETFTEFPETVSLAFSHIAAYGKFQFRELPETVTINSIELTAEEPVAGRFYFYPETGELSANSAGNTVTLDVDELGIETNNATDFWFAFKPVNLEGKTLKVSVNTDAGVYSRTVTFPTGKGNFQAGKVAAFTVNMSGITPSEDQVYTIVTDKSQLLAGTKVIIVAQDEAFAMSTTQNTNNRASASVVKSDDRTTVTNPGEAVQVFVLEAGTVEGTVAFKCENGAEAGKYIGSASSGNNYMRSFADAGDNTSFSVVIKDGYTVLTANGSYTRNTVRYNATNKPTMFSCYAPTSSVKAEVVLYALEGSGEGSSLITDPKCPTPEISYDPSTKTVSISCSEEGARIGYTIDGTEPGIDDTGAPVGTTQEYSEPFVISETCTVKAFAGAPGYEMSDIAEKECVVSAPGDYTAEELSGTFTMTDGDLVLTTTSGITVVQSKGDGSSGPNASYNTPSTMRVYKGNTLSFSGKTIKKIEITVNGSYYGCDGLDADTGTLNTTTTSGGTITWTGSATSVTITNAGSDNRQLRTSKIVVYY